MEAIYFGNAHWHGNTGAGTGPWAGADLEQGMYYGGGEMTQKNNNSLSLTSDFVSLTLKGRTDGFDLKGGDATQGKQRTMYSGPRPDRTLAGTCGRGGGTTITLATCVAGSLNQTWGFQKSGPHIATADDQCLDINSFKTSVGSQIWAWPCGSGAKENENWGLNATSIPSLQANTPFCLGAKGTAAGSAAALDSCTAATSSLTVGFTTDTSTSGSIVQTSSGLCFTVETGGQKAPGGYQPMRKKGAIILATGGDNSNSAMGNFYEGFMATGVASEATAEAIQANIVAVEYSGFTIPSDAY
jgi:hypothetical protein